MNATTNNGKKKQPTVSSAGYNPMFYTPSTKALPIWAQDCNWQKGGK